MSANSKIEWTDHTFNPWIGCAKIDPGCANCYADTQDQFRKWTPEGWGKGKPRKRTSAANWTEPLKWNRQYVIRDSEINPWCDTSPNLKHVPRERVFCASLADWLDDEVPIEWLADLLVLIRATPHLDWLLLTKRPGNWEKRLVAAFDHISTRDAKGMVESWLASKVSGPIAGAPPAHVWIGTSVCDQAGADKRIPELLAIPAKVRFLSCEPLLGAVDIRFGFQHLVEPTRPTIDWVICGGEGGPNARPMHPDWARSLRDQCQLAGVPFFFKQWGEWGASCYHGLADKDVIGKAEMTLPGPYSFYRVGKKAAGRLLDGREWSEFPKTGGHRPQLQRA